MVSAKTPSKSKAILSKPTASAFSLLLVYIDVPPKRGAANGVKEIRRLVGFGAGIGVR